MAATAESQVVLSPVLPTVVLATAVASPSVDSHVDAELAVTSTVEEAV